MNREEPVFITEEAYKPVWGDKSSVILLIALQILAVELMNNQGTDFTQNAYFPRLRELISDELPLESLLPFDPEEYEKVWSTFANEVKSYYKTKKAIITFDIKATQSFKNKIMPLSQALLSHSDLAKLGIILHDSGQLQTGTEIDYEFFFRKYKATLSTRGRECLSKTSVRKAVIDQFSSFIEVTPIETLKIIDTESSKLKKDFVFDLRLEEDPFDDFFEYKLDFRDDDGEVSRIDGNKKLLDYIIQNKYIALIKNFDYYTGGSNLSKKVEIEHLVFILKEESDINLIEVSLGIEKLEYEIKTIPENQLKVLILNDPRANSKIASIYKGRLKRGVETVSVEFKGGIRLSENGFSYLRNYTPDNLFIDGIKVNDSDTINLNNEILTCAEIKEYFKRHEMNEYNLNYKGKKIRVRVEDLPRVSASPIGFKVYSDSISVNCEECELSDKYISGFTLNNINRINNITQKDFLLFLTDLENHMVSVDEITIEQIEESIMDSKHLGKTHKEYLILRLRQTGKIPVALSRRIAA